MYSYSSHFICAKQAYLSKECLGAWYFGWFLGTRGLMHRWRFFFWTKECSWFWVLEFHWILSILIIYALIWWNSHDAEMYIFNDKYVLYYDTKYKWWTVLLYDMENKAISQESKLFQMTRWSALSIQIHNI